jgi:predicted nucleic acid-binding protein
VSAGLADTSVFIAAESGRPIDATLLPDDLFVSAITVGELRAGVLSAADSSARSRRLATLTRVLELHPLPVDDRVAEAWADLRVSLRDAGRRMPVNDSWIAATAIAHGLALVTQDADHERLDLPGLDVIRV